MTAQVSETGESTHQPDGNVLVVQDLERTYKSGTYEVRAVARDQQSNPPSLGLEADTALSTLVVVDRTSPTIEAKRKADTVEVVIKDELSTVARLEIVANGRVLFSPRCADGVCDNREEHFLFLMPQPSPSDPWTLRATDVAGNKADILVPAP